MKVAAAIKKTIEMQEKVDEVFRMAGEV